MDNENLIEYDLTMHGIHKMYCSLFEKFGWMILLKHKGDKIKSKIYLKCVKNLTKNIIRKEKSVSNKDKKKDCEIMEKNLEYLIKHAEKDFKLKNNITHHFPKNNKNMVEYDTTMHGLHKWYDSVFQKLGWMIIVNEHKDSKRIEEYYSCILKLYKSIDLKHAEL